MIAERTLPPECHPQMSDQPREGGVYSIRSLVVTLPEQVRVNSQRHVGRSMAEPLADRHYFYAGVDQLRGMCMP